MDAPHRGDVARDRVVLGTMGIAALALLSGVGGPPSIFRQDLHPWIKYSAQYLLALYLGGLSVAVVAVIVAVATPRIGRLVGTGAATLTTLGNALSALVGSGGEARGAAFFSLFLLPFLLLMWRAPSKKHDVRRPVA